jgi:V/A-type H+-transporting ATPase subunit F
MKIVVLGNQDEVIGFSLAGVDILEIQDDEDFVKKMSKVLSQDDIGIIVVVDRYFNIFQEKFSENIRKKAVPAVVFIPSIDGIYIKKDIKGFLAGVLGIRF